MWPREKSRIGAIRSWGTPSFSTNVHWIFAWAAKTRPFEFESLPSKNDLESYVEPVVGRGNLTEFVPLFFCWYVQELRQAVRWVQKSSASAPGGSIFRSSFRWNRRGVLKLDLWPFSLKPHPSFADRISRLPEIVIFFSGYRLSGAEK